MDVRLQQIIGKAQTTPGTAETLTASEGKARLVYGSDVDYPPEQNEIDRARAITGPAGSVPGKKPMTMNAIVYAAPLDAPATDTLEIAAELEAAGLSLTQVKRIAIGAVTSGPVARGATVTGGTSSGTGRVVLPVTTGDAYVYYVPITGTLQAEALSFTGGATATSSGAPTNYGWAVAPSAPGLRKVGTFKFEEDGMAYTMRDAVAGMTLAAEDGKLGIFTFALQGAKHSIAAAAMTSGISFPTSAPLALLNAAPKIGSAAIDLHSFSLDTQPVIAARTNAGIADNTGLNGYRITHMRPKLTLAFEMPLSSTYDVNADVENGTPRVIQLRLGSVAGKSIWLFADEAVAQSAPRSEAEGIRRVSMDWLCTTTTTGRPFELLFI